MNAAVVWGLVAAGFVAVAVVLLFNTGGFSTPVAMSLLAAVVVTIVGRASEGPWQ